MLGGFRSSGMPLARNLMATGARLGLWAMGLATADVFKIHEQLWLNAAVSETCAHRQNSVLVQYIDSSVSGQISWARGEFNWRA